MRSFLIGRRPTEKTVPKADHYHGWQLSNIDLDIIKEAYSLPETFHADPADRILTATARINDFTLLTADNRILDYPHVDAVW